MLCSQTVFKTHVQFLKYKVSWQNVVNTCTLPDVEPQNSLLPGALRTLIAAALRSGPDVHRLALFGALQSICTDVFEFSRGR